MPMRMLDRLRRPAPPPPPPPPYTFADPSAAAHSELAASLVPPPLAAPVSVPLPLPQPRAPSSVLGERRKPPRARRGLSALPLSVLHRVCELALAVPRGWDEDADAARARAALYALRSVDRRFFLGTSHVTSRPAPR